MTDKRKDETTTLYQVIELGCDRLMKTEVRHNLSQAEAQEFITARWNQSRPGYMLQQKSRHINHEASTCTRCQRAVIEALYPKPKPTTK